MTTVPVVKPGDQIRVTLNGTVRTVYNQAGEVDILLESGNVVYEIPIPYVVVIKPAAPPEPPIGSIIQYYASDKYIRLASGWTYIPTVPGERMGMTHCKWEIFGHENVKVLYAAPPKKSLL